MANRGEAPAWLARMGHSNMSAGQMNLAFGGVCFTKYLWGENTELLPRKELRNESTSLMPSLLILSRGEAHLLKADNVVQATWCIAVANSVSRSLGTQMTAADATERGRHQLWAFLKYEIGNGNEDLVHVRDADITTPGFEPAIPGWPPSRMEMRNMAAEPPAGLTPAHCSTIMEFLFNKAQPLAIMGGTYIYSLAFISLAKRGTIEPSKLAKITEGIKSQTTRTIALDVNLVKYCYATVLQKLPEAEIGQCLEYWASLVGDSCLQLRLVLEQAKNSGMVVLQCVRKAMLMFPGFNWNVIARNYPNDIVNLKLAIQAVGQNKYYGFKANLGAVRSTQYKSLAYVAKALLIKHGGPEYATLGSYKGWPATISNQQEVDTMILEFNPTADDNPQAAANLTDLIAALPAATGLDP
nr:MAG: putative nucleoprotein [Wuhan mivirus]WAS28366.1 MAG: putative nucleoprotein [Wuhan mivirus]WAS28370.1 MAG: putative nucleoprotein [Wuhan mivirus]WAS28378.1 MAG: putative nucleoprotein [Wuhan mivirus]